MQQAWAVITCFITFAFLTMASAETLKIPMPRYENDLSHQYHVTLLKMALQHSSIDDELPSFEYEFEMSEGRAVMELMKGKLIDVYWLGADQDRERDLRAIPIPTTRGLIGFRQFIIQRNALGQFEKIRNIKDLSRYVACQGTSWPDVRILEASGLKVTATPLLENLYRMLAAGRCDYLPRGYHDVKKEMQARQNVYPNLMSYHSILLHYPFAVYFFTNRQNEALALRIEQGLNKLVKSGQLLSHMQNNPLTKHIFPLTQKQPALFLSIENPHMHKAPQYSDHRYWFVPEDFGIAIPISEK